MTRIRVSQAEERNRLMRARLEMSIAEIELSVRTTNCLEETGIFTVRDLLNTTPKKLLSISNFGEKTLEEVYQALAKLGFERPTGAVAATEPTAPEAQASPEARA
jgi:DNA-directed RNA polymerase subunit alpha